VAGQRLVNNVSEKLLRLLAGAEGITCQDLGKGLLNMGRGDLPRTARSLTNILRFNRVFHRPPANSPTSAVLYSTQMTMTRPLFR